MPESKLHKETFSFYTYFICIFVAFGGFLFGYDTSNIAGVMGMPNWLMMFGKVRAAGYECGGSKYEPEGGDIQYCLSSVNKSLITSLLSIGTCGGALSGAIVADRLGRKGGIITAICVFIAGCAIQTGGENVPALIVGRVVAGGGVGLISMMVPMYQAEAAPPAVRGALVSFYQFSITCGILLAQGVDLGTQGIMNTASWRVPIGLQLLWGVILLAGISILPESPRYLIKKGNPEQARRNLAKMRSKSEHDPEIQAEFSEIVNNYEFELTLGESTYAECFKGTMWARTWCGINVQMFQQLTGVNFVFYFGTTFFQNAGIKKPYLITLATGIVNVVCTLPGIWMVERLGRRKFLLFGAIWMCSCQLIIGAVSVGESGTETANNVLVAFTCLFIAGFAATWGPGAWVLISELYPLKLRGKAMSLATCSNWWWNWVIAFCVPYITDAQYGNLQTKIAFIWFATSFCGALWTFFYVPETSGHSLEELDEMFEARLPPRKTVGWKPTGASIAHQPHVEEKYNIEAASVTTPTSEKDVDV